MPEPKIVDSAEIRKRPRKNPATRLIENLPEGYLTARQVAEMFGVNIETIRRLGRQVDEDGRKRFVAPSKAARTGDLVVYLYTEEDLEEIADYFGQSMPRKAARKRR